MMESGESAELPTTRVACVHPILSGVHIRRTGDDDAPAVEHADEVFFLPGMCGITQSFNLSVAIAISLYNVVASGAAPEGALSEDERVELMARWLVRTGLIVSPSVSRGSVAVIPVRVPPVLLPPVTSTQ